LENLPVNASAAAPQGRCVIVIPCYNEAQRLQPQAFFDFLALGSPVRFLFVNDGSKDGTIALLHSMRAAHPDAIFVLDKKANGGKGEAIRDGMITAMRMEGCAFTGFWDADLATPLIAIPDLLATLEAGPALQMVFGARVRLLGRTIHRKAARHYAGRIFATAASSVLSIPVYDTQCGAKIFRVTPDLEYVLAEPFASRWIFDVEIVARFIQRRGHDFGLSAIYEFPLQTWQDVGGSKLRGSDFLRAALDLVTIHRRYLAKNSQPY
jgi:glycosyltransferase involved in cell wall biosynthesis